jgi:Ca2+-binding EF-hand superfamily protein
MTRQDLADYYRKAGVTPFQFQNGPQTAGQQFQVVFAGQPPPLRPDALNEKLFALLDTNKDGKLSRAELTAAPDVLQKMDLDDDETVNGQEIAGNAPSSIGSDVAFAVAMPGQQQQPPPPFFMVKPGEGGKDLARQLLQRYGPKNQRPAARKLTRQNLGLTQEAFDKLDVDGDGVLDSEELARFARRPPDLEIRVRLGKKEARETAVELIGPKDGALAKKVRQGGDGSLAIDLGTTQLDLRREPGTSTVAVVRAQREQYIAQFRNADRDKNGYLDKGEADRSQFFRGQFKMMDRDGDGKLFEKEMLAYLDKMKDLQAGATAACASLSVKDQGRGLFDMFDLNGDGRLSLREMRLMVNLVDKLDRDGDDAVSRSEIPHKYQVEVRQGPASGNQFGPRVLPRRPGMNQQPLPERTKGPMWFRKMDRNHDGDVSRREFLGTDEEFRKIDTDGDGLIDDKEADAADKLFRKEKVDDEPQKRSEKDAPQKRR